MSPPGALPFTPQLSAHHKFFVCVWWNTLSTLSSSPRCVELGRIKCTQYWPDKEGQSKWYGEIQVDFLKEHPCGSYVLRMFSLKREVNMLTQASLSSCSQESYSARWHFCTSLRPSMHTVFPYMFGVCNFSPDASTMILFVGDPFWLLWKMMASIGRLVLLPRWMIYRLTSHFSLHFLGVNV